MTTLSICWSAVEDMAIRGNNMNERQMDLRAYMDKHEDFKNAYTEALNHSRQKSRWESSYHYSTNN